MKKFLFLIFSGLLGLCAFSSCSSSSSGGGGGGSAELPTPEVTIEAVGLTDNKCSVGSSVNLVAESSVADVEFEWQDYNGKDISSTFNYSKITKKSRGSITVPEKSGKYTYTAIAYSTADKDKYGYEEITLTVTANDVSNSELKSISVNNITVKVGSEESFVVTAIYTEGKSEKTMDVTDLSKFETTSEYIELSNSKVKGIKIGNATVKVTYEGKEASATVTVIDPTITVESISLSKAALSLEIGKTEKLSATATYSNSTSSEVSPSYISSDESVATVSADGTVTAIKEGSATIKATYEGKEASCTVNVTTPTVTLKSIQASVGNSTISKDGTTSLTVTATYTDNTTHTVTPTSVTSSNESVAKYSNGNIIGVAEGSAEFTITYVETGVSAEPVKVTVNVVKPEETEGSGTIGFTFVD